MKREVAKKPRESSESMFVREKRIGEGGLSLSWVLQIASKNDHAQLNDDAES